MKVLSCQRTIIGTRVHCCAVVSGASSCGPLHTKISETGSFAAAALSSAFRPAQLPAALVVRFADFGETDLPGAAVKQARAEILNLRGERR
jgi:hypothetical protein